MKITLLIIGLIIGGAIGWYTAPAPAVDMKIGGVTVEVQKGQDGGELTATGPKGGSLEIGSGNLSPLADRTTRTAIFAIGGGIIGLILGFVVGGRRQAV
jgi:hypothetical protein